MASTAIRRLALSSAAAAAARVTSRRTFSSSTDPAVAAAAFHGRMTKLITLSGGTIEDDMFVTKPGCLLLAKTELVSAAAGSSGGAVSELFTSLNIDNARPSYEQFGEFNSRITYLSFKEKPSSSEKFNYKMAREHGHLSVFGPIHATFLLAGISLETSLELIAHSEARVARLTSSKTAAMSHPLFRIQSKSPEEKQSQKQYLKQVVASRVAPMDVLARGSNPECAVEFGNMLLPGVKTTALTYTMSVKDFHKMFIGRLNQAGGNETEVQEVCALMCSQLHREYPLVVRSVDEYGGMTNKDKDKPTTA